MSNQQEHSDDTTPFLSSLWTSWVMPVPAQMTVPSITPGQAINLVETTIHNLGQLQNNTSHQPCLCKSEITQTLQSTVPYLYMVLKHLRDTNDDATTVAYSDINLSDHEDDGYSMSDSDSDNDSDDSSSSATVPYSPEVEDITDVEDNTEDKDTDSDNDATISAEVTSSDIPLTLSLEELTEQLMELDQSLGLIREEFGINLDEVPTTGINIELDQPLFDI